MLTAGSDNRYCLVVRDEFPSSPPSLTLDESATSLASGLASIDNLHFSLSRVSVFSPSTISNTYWTSLKTLPRLRESWSALKSPGSDSLKSEARISFHNLSTSARSSIGQISAHISRNCDFPVATPPMSAAPTPAQASGGASSPAAARAVPTNVRPAAAAPSLPTPPAVPGSGEASVRLALTNQARTQARQCGGVAYPSAPPLAWDTQIESAARVQSNYQSQIRTMTHSGPGGSTLADRVTSTGFAWRSIGENVAWNYSSASEALQGWLNSPGHCANIMNPRYTVVGWVTVDGYDTMDLARPR